MKGGGDAVSAARAVLQTGEYDYAWNLQVEDDILRRLEQGGKGRVNIWPTGNPEHIQCNLTDPWTEVDGERSSVKTTHPLLSDPAVRQALNLLVDRAAVQEQIYGRQRADQRQLPQRAVALLLEEHPLGVQRGQGQPGPRRGGLEARRRRHPRPRTASGSRSSSRPRSTPRARRTRQIVKQAAAKAGIEIELKSVVASVFFSSDPANPDTYPHFYADLQMYNTDHDRAGPRSTS